MKKPTNKEIRACDGSILNIEPMANSQKIAVAKKMVKARPATMKLVLKSLKTHHFFCIKPYSIISDNFESSLFSTT